MSPVFLVHDPAGRASLFLVVLSTIPPQQQPTSVSTNNHHDLLAMKSLRPLPLAFITKHCCSLGRITVLSWQQILHGHGIASSPLEGHYITPIFFMESHRGLYRFPPHHHNVE